MTSLSKILPYTCYELGHTWHHSCMRSSFEIFIVGVAESLKMFGVVYLVSTLMRRKMLTLKDAQKILKDYLQSVCFLSINAFGYIGSFCVFRHLLGNVNFISASYLPGFAASLMAILIERVPRRQLNAIYVTNVASECIWNQVTDRSWIKPIPQGEVLIFASAMAVLGYFYRTSSSFSPLIKSILQLILGKKESGQEIAKRQAAALLSNREEYLEGRAPTLSLHKRIINAVKTKHSSCPHQRSCIQNLGLEILKGGIKGYSLQFLIKFIFSIVPAFRNPSLLKSLVLNRQNFAAAAFCSWLTASYGGVCCFGRWLSGEDKAYHGSIAGFIAGLSMYFYSSPTIAVYVFWKTIEAVYEKGYNDGVLPRIPGSIELLYSLSTGYLFHMAAVEPHNMKPSYWRFLMRLTGNRFSEYNHHLLEPYGQNSSTMFFNRWPDYDTSHITGKFLDKFAHQIATGRPL